MPDKQGTEASKTKRFDIKPHILIFVEKKAMLKYSHIPFTSSSPMACLHRIGMAHPVYPC